MNKFPALDVVKHSGTVTVVNGNRRLFVHRVLASMGIIPTVRVFLRRLSAPFIQRERWDDRLGRSATKLERSLSSSNDGAWVRVQSRYRDLQSSVFVHPQFPQDMTNIFGRPPSHRRSSTSPRGRGTGGLAGMIRSPRANSLDIPITFVDHGANVSAALVPAMAEFEPLLTSALQPARTESPSAPEVDWTSCESQAPFEKPLGPAPAITVEVTSEKQRRRLEKK